MTRLLGWSLLLILNIGVIQACTAIQELSLRPDAEPTFTCSIDWFSETNFEDACPSTEAQSIDSVYQAFEHGFMIRQLPGTNIWFYVSTTDTFYVRPLDMMRDAQPFTGDIHDGFIRPEGDFGALWGGSAFVRDELGWAIAPQETYTMHYQETTTPMGTRLDRYRLFTLPDNTIVEARFGEF